MSAGHLNSETEDGVRRDGWTAWARGRSRDERHPRLRLLYHADLDRMGAMSVPGAVTSSWLTLGRSEPLFADAAGNTAPLGDPHVSREQLRVRWRPDLARFEIEPAPSGRRPLHVVDLDRKAGAPSAPSAWPALLEPGACVAIGDRVLLGLELCRVRSPDDDCIGLVGESEILWALRDEIRSVARFGGSALVIGPTGAGKELVARALHRSGPRAAGPFVAVNCAALPETLVEATLFGHKRGAFTGADAEGKGLFRAADGGTLFLDELGELPLSVQPKLLRVLQDGVVVPVGSHEGKSVDVRIVAATHRDLEAQVRAGGLREDLYHRMSAHVLRVPSLAARRFDIPELFVHMLRRLRDAHPEIDWLWRGGREWRPSLPIGFVAELLRRPWRGNVRELANLAERTARVNLQTATFRSPDALDATGAPGKTGTTGASEEPSPSAPVPPRPSMPPSSGPTVPDALLRTASETLGLAHKTVLKLLPAEALAALPDSLAGDDLARAIRSRASEALLALLEGADFNQSSVAAILGISRTTLIKLMDDLGLPRATDLDAERIAQAREQAGGDLEAAAKLLRVSPSALKKRLTILALKSRG